MMDKPCEVQAELEMGERYGVGGSGRARPKEAE